MIETTELFLQQVCAEPYEIARAQHGDLGLTLESFASKVEQVIQVSTPHPAHDPALISCRIQSLHTGDLYLSLACAGGGNAAWERFLALYGKFITEVAACACSYQDWAEDVADAVLAGLLMRGPSGASRLSTYDGTAMLRTWLRAVVLNRAMDERRLRANWFDRLDARADWPAPDTTAFLETHCRTLTDGDKIVAAFQHACNSISGDDRYLLLMRYEQDLQVTALQS
jgi:DNA-directed RNA polymerase specialized sigma24 family protein